MSCIIKVLALTQVWAKLSMQPESSDGFASVGTILPKEEAALLPGGLFASGGANFHADLPPGVCDEIPVAGKCLRGGERTCPIRRTAGLLATRWAGGRSRMHE